MKKLTIFAVVLLAIICIMGNVYAAETFNITAQTEKNEFNKNDEIVVQFNLSNMQVGEGIISLGATLEYDKDSLELLRTEGQNGWTITHNAAEGIMFFENNSLIKDNGGFFKAIFKVKESSKANLTIKLKDITAGGAGPDINAANVEKAIVIKTDSSNNGGNNGNNSSVPDNNNNGNNSGNNNNGGNSNNGTSNGNNNSGSNNNGNGNNNNNENSKPDTIISTNDKNPSGSTANDNKNNVVKIPQAGENDTVLFVLIGAASVSAIVFFAKAIKTNKTQK